MNQARELPAGRQDNPPVHEKTRIGSDFRYRCFNRKNFASGYWAPNRVHGFDGRFTVELTWIKHVMSMKCQYDRHESDPACAGCKRGGEYERV